MAYRALVVGDDVKIRDFGNDWHGNFGEVLDIEGAFVKVLFHSWHDGPSTTAYFTEDKLLLSVGNPYRHIEMNQDDEDSFTNDEDLPTDDEVIQQLLQRVAKLEKEMLEMRK